MTPTENWPKTFILQAHAAAVEQGFVWIEPIDEEDAASFRLRFYRVRRRSDTSMAAFIPAEYHLVMVGKWEPGPNALGRLPIIYNKRADGRPLPSIIPATPDEVETYSPPRAVALPPPLIPIPSQADLELKPEEIGSLVERLRQQAKERH